ncbi:uncharacterized protein Dmoj_GI25943 [Drosophila mojavensis]|uniref:Uncharacterized protein n=1 Tax=Drosophila mojavensis TaxID=7230 RepID=A0A0Q9XPJ9_DROMO|nr:uncharacterized protein Dmoj_GI25943 [Drosophila mojavensis]
MSGSRSHVKIFVSASFYAVQLSDGLPLRQDVATGVHEMTANYSWSSMLRHIRSSMPHATQVRCPARPTEKSRKEKQRNKKR